MKLTMPQFPIDGGGGKRCARPQFPITGGGGKR